MWKGQHGSKILQGTRNMTYTPQRVRSYCPKVTGIRGGFPFQLQAQFGISHAYRGKADKDRRNKSDECGEWNRGDWYHWLCVPWRVLCGCVDKVARGTPGTWKWRAPRMKEDTSDRQGTRRTYRDRSTPLRAWYCSPGHVMGLSISVFWNRKLLFFGSNGTPPRNLFKRFPIILNWAANWFSIIFFNWVISTQDTLLILLY